jgi:hypothetical protein
LGLQDAPGQRDHFLAGGGFLFDVNLGRH